MNLFALSSSSPWAWEVHSRNYSCHCLVTCAVPSERPALAWLGCWYRGVSVRHLHNYVFPYTFWQCHVWVGDVFVPRALGAAQGGGHPHVPHWCSFSRGHSAVKPAGHSLYAVAVMGCFKCRCSSAVKWLCETHIQWGKYPQPQCNFNEEPLGCVLLLLPFLGAVISGNNFFFCIYLWSPLDGHITVYFQSRCCTMGI